MQDLFEKKTYIYLINTVYVVGCLKNGQKTIVFTVASPILITWWYNRRCIEKVISKFYPFADENSELSFADIKASSRSDAVYSGRRRGYTQMMPLTELCIFVLGNHIDGMSSSTSTYLYIITSWSLSKFLPDDSHLLFRDGTVP